MKELNVNLHIHSTYSDGTENIKSLMNKINDSNLDYYSITDHDNVFAYEELDLNDERLILGCELSLEYNGLIYHTLVYNFDLIKLNNLLSTYIRESNAYIKNVFNKLREDYPNLELPLKKYLMKTHIANELIEKGYFSSKNKARKCFTEYAKDFKNPKHITMKEARNHLDKAYFILAHPYQVYGIGDFGIQINEEKVKQNIKKFKELDLIDGIEANYYAYDLRKINYLNNLAIDFELIVTHGTDYHGKSTRPTSIPYKALHSENSIVYKIEES